MALVERTLPGPEDIVAFAADHLPYQARTSVVVAIVPSDRANASGSAGDTPDDSAACKGFNWSRVWSSVSYRSRQVRIWLRSTRSNRKSRSSRTSASVSPRIRLLLCSRSFANRSAPLKRGFSEDRGNLSQVRPIHPLPPLVALFIAVPLPRRF